MARSETPSFILELELFLDPHEQKEVRKKMNIGRQIYNACLGEALKGLHRVLADPEYKLVLKEIKSKERTKRLKEIEQSHGYSDYQLQAWAAQCGRHFEGLLGSGEVQKLATRAFKAVEKVHYKKARQVHFKKADELISIENKFNNSGLRWKDGKVLWGKLSMTALIPKKDDYVREALESKNKFVRIVRKIIRGKERFYVQLIQEGFPPVKKHAVVGPSDERVGIDPGTSTMAIASETAVWLEELAPDTSADEKELRRIQRAMDRSRRATNPDNFKEDGTVVKGKKTWTYSNRYKKLAARRKELYRRMAVKRKQSHEELANRIIAIGLDVRVETMSYRGLQKRSRKITHNRKNGKINSKKRFGKSLGNRAPAMFLDILERKLSYHGQELKKVDTAALRASQFDHTTGRCTKKELKDRWNLIDGKKVQRDLYSAFLIANTNKRLNAVDVKRANQWYDHFLELHDLEVKRLKQSKSKTLKWFVA